ncbi:RING finger protein nhl-1-like isoform X2 [Bacillus rossius redtenbacheri]|uniref:RING finger protein nhl-1-like isoform X2 n=1 Tax=Bacillus rossius redtenbacheri TaxID=93214 RepID=UPI002FDC8E69
MMSDNSEVELLKRKGRGLKLGRLFLGRTRSPSPGPLSPSAPSPAAQLSTSPTQAGPWARSPSRRDEEELIPRRHQVARSNTSATTFTFDTPAARAPEQRRTVSTVEDLLKCGICLQRFSDPKMLRCQHTFCAECLQERIIFGTGRNNILLACPACGHQERMSVKSPEQTHAAIGRLPSNLYMNSLLSVLQGATEAAPPGAVPLGPAPDAQEAPTRCCKCQTACDTKNCAHCKQVFCAVCWSAHVSELQGQLQDLEEQLSDAEQRLQYRAEDFQARCQELEAAIGAAVEAKRQALEAEESRLRQELAHVLEAARLDAAQLSERLDRAASAALGGGGAAPHASDQSKVAAFLSLHKTTAELLDEVAHWGEVTPVLDLELSKVDLQSEVERDDDDTECDEGLDGSKLRPELISDEEDMAVYYRTRTFAARMLLGNSIVHRPGGVALCPWGPPHHLYVAGNDNRQVAVFDLAKGRLQRRMSAPNMIFPHGLAFCAKRQEMYVTDKWGHCIHVFDKEGSFCRTLCSRGHGEGQLRSPEGIAVGPDPDNPKDGILLYVCDTNNDRLQVLRPEDGSMVRQIGIEKANRKDGKYLTTEFNQPSGVAVSGNMMVVADFGNSKVKVFSTLGAKLLDLGAPGSFKSPECVAIDRLGFILVGDSGNARVQVFGAGGGLVRVFGRRGSGPGRLRWVSGLHVADNMDIFLTDCRNHCILVF